MDDKTDIGLVDAHAEGDGGDDDLYPVVDKFFLGMGALPVGQAGVIGQCPIARFEQLPGNLLCPFTAQAVDDPGLPLPGTKEPDKLLEGVDLVLHQVPDSRSIETGDKAAGVTQAQPVDNVCARMGLGGGGQGHDGNVGEPAAEVAELSIFRPEIMAPLGNAVRLIDGEQGNLTDQQTVQEILAHQPLRRDVEQLQPALMKLPQDRPGRLRRK